MCTRRHMRAVFVFVFEALYTCFNDHMCTMCMPVVLLDQRNINDGAMVVQMASQDSCNADTQQSGHQWNSHMPCHVLPCARSCAYSP